MVIVGSGAFAQGLASLAQRSGAVAAYGIVLGSRKMKNNDNAHLPGLETVPVRSLGTALPKSDMVGEAPARCLFTAAKQLGMLQALLPYVVL